MNEKRCERPGIMRTRAKHKVLTFLDNYYNSNILNKSDRKIRCFMLLTAVIPSLFNLIPPNSLPKIVNLNRAKWPTKSDYACHKFGPPLNSFQIFIGKSDGKAAIANFPSFSTSCQFPIEWNNVIHGGLLYWNFSIYGKVFIKIR